MDRSFSAFVLGLLFLFLLATANGGSAEPRDTTELPIRVSTFHNAPALPFSGGAVTPPLHPGLEIAGSFPITQPGDHRFRAGPALGYYYHHLAKHGIYALGQLHYRYRVTDRFHANAHGAVGYLHSIPAIAFYETGNGNGVEKALQWGRPQVAGGIGIGPAYRVGKEERVTLFLDYRFWLQWPFVNAYVPVLPNTALHIGVRFPIAQKENP